MEGYVQPVPFFIQRARTFRNLGRRTRQPVKCQYKLLFPCRNSVGYRVPQPHFLGASIVFASDPGDSDMLKRFRRKTALIVAIEQPLGGQTIESFANRDAPTP